MPKDKNWPLKNQLCQAVNFQGKPFEVNITFISLEKVEFTMRDKSYTASLTPNGNYKSKTLERK